MKEARVIRVPPEQANALPVLDDAEIAGFQPQHHHLPFPSLYLDLGRVPAPRVTGESPHLLVGAGVWRIEPSGGLPAGVLVVQSFICGNSARAIVSPVPGLCVSTEIDGVFATRPNNWQELGDDNYWQEKLSRPGLPYLVAERVWAVLGFLASYNVELVDAPLSRRQRARELRKGRQIALVVRVKPPKRRASKHSGSARDFSHRFEVAGHYIHHFERKADGTPNSVFARYATKRPDKVVQIGGQDCVRFWQPPHVKGPEGKPLVPKVRVLA